MDQFDLRNLPDSFYLDPYPTYAALQAQSPVHRLSGGAVLLTRYADLRSVYRDPVLFSSDKQVAFGAVFGDSPLLEHHTTSLVFNDPPLHTRVRQHLTTALSPRAIAHREPGLIKLVDRLLDQIEAESSDGGVFDAIESFAAAIPVAVICGLMNIPESQRGALRGWSLAILSALEPDPGDTLKQAGNQAVEEFLSFLRDLIAHRRQHPLDPETDILTRLIETTGVSNGLTEKELLHNCIFILNAGHETTTNLVGNGLYLLLSNEPARERLRQNPGLIDSTVEEVLRMESPNQLGNRVTTGPCSIGGEALPPGTQLTLCIGAANRDPLQFEDPDRFDIARHPNRHLAFINGPHVCAGVNLARLEGRVAIGRFMARLPTARLAGRPQRAQRARFRGFTYLPLAL